VSGNTTGAVTFLAFANYGGGTDTRPVQGPNANIIGAGERATANTRDQRGYVRPCVVSKGAHEPNASLVTDPLANKVWLGCLSTAWFVSSNWAPAGAPISTSRVFIPGTATAPNQPSLPGSTTIRTLTIDASNGASLSISPAAVLTVTN
jgi:hypothetical protein